MQKTSTEATRRWRAANLERARELGRKSYQKNKAKVRAKHKEWYEANKERHLDARKKRIAANPEQEAEKRRAQYKKWWDANLDKARSYARNRIARKKGAEGDYTAADIARMLEGQRHRCWWCGCKLQSSRYHVDHRIALTKGGSNGPGNLVIACIQCNVRKNNKSPAEFCGRLL